MLHANVKDHQKSLNVRNEKNFTIEKTQNYQYLNSRKPNKYDFTSCNNQMVINIPNGWVHAGRRDIKQMNKTHRLVPFWPAPW